jgi:hypothetical protein
MKAKAWPDRLPDADRITLARARTDKLVDHVRSLFLMHETNQIVAYSPLLTAQIPRSYAGHAFAQFQKSMLLFEIVRLCAIWDGKGSDRASLATIVALYDTPEIRSRIEQETYDYHLATGAAPPIGDRALAEWAKSEALKRATQERTKVQRRLERVAAAVNCLTKSKVVTSAMEFRNQYIAHNLDLPSPDLKVEEAPPRAMKYGDERRLLRVTVRLVDDLHYALNGASFAWDDAREQAKRSASQLWDNCKFSIPGR